MAENATRGDDRSRLRSDVASLEDAFGSRSAMSRPEETSVNAPPRIIGLGPMYASIAVELHELFTKQHKRPILKARRDEIVERYSQSDGSVIMCQLREKGVLYTEEGGTEVDVSCCMDTNVILYRTRRGHSEDELEVVWPPEHAGKTVAQVKELLAIGQTDNEPGDEEEQQQADPICDVTAPIVLRGQKLGFYLDLMDVAHKSSGQAMTHSELVRVALARPEVKAPATLIRDLEQLGLLQVTSGIKHSKSDPTMRVVMFLPFEDGKGNIMTPSGPVATTTHEVPDEIEEVIVHVDQQVPDVGSAEPEEDASEHLIFQADADPFVFSQRQVDSYEVLIALARRTEFRPLVPGELKKEISKAGVKSPHSMIHRFDREGVCKIVGGQPGSRKEDTLRRVVLRPYRCGVDGPIIVPHECQALSGPAESVQEPIAVQAEDVSQEPAAEPTRTIRSREDLRELLAQAKLELQSLKDEEIDRQLAHMQGEIVSLDQEEERLHTRLEEIEAERTRKASELQQHRIRLEESLVPEGSEALSARILRITSAIEAYDLIVVD